VARSYLDENITEELAVRLTALGNDAVTTNALRRKGARDQQQLLFAAQQHRILITSNGEDFRLLHDAWRDWSAAWGIRPARGNPAHSPEHNRPHRRRNGTNGPRIHPQRRRP
jgi:hypothetical protein